MRETAPLASRRWIGVCATILGVGLMGGIAAWAVLGRDTKLAPRSASSTSISPLVSTTDVPLPTGNFTVGYLHAGSDVADVQAAIDAMEPAGGVFGRKVAFVEKAASADNAPALAEMKAQGVGALVTDVGADELRRVLATASAIGWAVCAPGDVSGKPVGTVMLVATPTSCVVALALAAASARSSSPAKVAGATQDILSGDGLPCRDFASCMAIVSGDQPVRYSPEQGTISFSDGR